MDKRTRKVRKPHWRKDTARRTRTLTRAASWLRENGWWLVPAILTALVGTLFVYLQSAVEMPGVNDG